MKRHAEADLNQRQDILSLFMTRKNSEGQDYVCKYVHAFDSS